MRLIGMFDEAGEKMAVRRELIAFIHEEKNNNKVIYCDVLKKEWGSRPIPLDEKNSYFDKCMAELEREDWEEEWLEKTT